MAMEDQASVGQGAGPERSDAGERFKDRVRQWRQEAILQAVTALLTEQGCQHLTMDNLAKRVGVAKGSLYLHTNARDDLIGQVLDRRAAELHKPADPSTVPAEDRWDQLLDALFARPPSELETESLGFPCCLFISPCPHGWTCRWETLVRAYQLDSAPHGLSTGLLGEALQALSSLASLRALVRDGHASEAKALVQQLLSSYKVSAQKEGAPNGAPSTTSP